MQQLLFDCGQVRSGIRRYLPILSVVENRKGVLDVDTVKGCAMGMLTYPDGGCYGECYAYKAALRYGIDFSTSVSRKITRSNSSTIFYQVKRHRAAWYRVGVAGDPSHDWEHTISVCEFLQPTRKIPVIVTKHWYELSDFQIERLGDLNAVINTSTSGLDTDSEIKYRVEQIVRLRRAGVCSACRVVTCEFGNSEWARNCRDKQDYLLSLAQVINTPLRASKSNRHVMNGDIILRSVVC